MRIVFMGTPAFAVPSLRALVDAGHTVCGVFTQPDKPKNRGMRLTFSPVKDCALALELPVFQPQNMRDGEAAAQLRALAPELVVVAAYGQILPQEMLDIPPLGCINVHASLLPRYRGAAPINYAILNGDRTTGVTIMRMVRALDAGAMLLTAQTEILPEEDAGELTERLSQIGADALLRAVAQIENGESTDTPQDETLVTYAKMLDRSMSPIDWTQSAAAIHNRVRALIPWPCATMTLEGKTVKVFRVRAGEPSVQAAGTVLGACADGIAIACGDGESIVVTELQVEGGRRMSAADYLRGHPLKPL